MRDDTVPPRDAASGARRPWRWIAERLGAIPWQNAISGRWWWRWFKHSIYQSGRLTTFLALILLMGVQISQPGILKLLEARIFDFYQQAKPRQLLEKSPVVIIDIDEKSIAEQGQFPWPRTIVADLIRRLTEMGVEVIGFDIMWPEEDQTSISKVVNSVPPAALDEATRARLKQLPTNDQILAETIAASGKVVLGQTIVP